MQKSEFELKQIMKSNGKYQEEAIRIAEQLLKNKNVV